jgi:hypothetical protein
LQPQGRSTEAPRLGVADRRSMSMSRGKQVKCLQAYAIKIKAFA